jgi:hypothetical protein
LSVLLALLAALFVSLVIISFRAVRSLTGEGAGESRAYLSALARAVRDGDDRALDALASDGSSLGKALAAALDTRRQGGRARLAVREEVIAARARATRALLPLRLGATLGSVLGLLGALAAYLAPAPESFPLAQLTAGTLEMDVMGRAALSIVCGLGVHA